MRSDISVISFKSPRNARNAAEIRGFCAAVPEVRIHLPPAASLVRTRFLQICGAVPRHRQEDAFIEEDWRYLLANARATWLTAS
jgi:hypothetical protein